MGFHHCESDAFLSIGSLPSVSASITARPNQRTWDPALWTDDPFWRLQGLSFRISRNDAAGEWVVRGTGVMEPNDPPNAGVYGDHPGAPYEIAYLTWNYNELNPTRFMGASGWELDVTTKEGYRIHLRIKVHTTTLLDGKWEQLTIETLTGHNLAVDLQVNACWNAFVETPA